MGQPDHTKSRAEGEQAQEGPTCSAQSVSAEFPGVPSSTSNWQEWGKVERLGQNALTSQSRCVPLIVL